MAHRSALGRPPGSRRSDLAHGRGMGAAGEGTSHWYWERLTALAMVPLTLWLLWALLTGVGADHSAFRAWVAMPGNMALLILASVFFFWHSWIAIGVVISDYVHHEGWKFAGMIAVKFGCIFFGAFTLVAIVLTGLGG
jgi:succinate dehydrogenase / fumarate reductase, membrane anchor subunit